MRGSPSDLTPMRLSDMRTSIPIKTTKKEEKKKKGKKVRLDTHAIERGGMSGGGGEEAREYEGVDEGEMKGLQLLSLLHTVGFFFFFLLFLVPFWT